MLAELKGDNEAKHKNCQLTVVTQYLQDQLQDPDTWGSSSSTVEPTWAKTKHDNLDEALKQWDETPTRIPDRPTRERTCQTWGNIMSEAQVTASPHCMTCHVLDQHPVQPEPQRHAREERDDEVEFTRIPIAGEDSEDYMSDNDSDSNNDEATPVFTQNMTRIIIQPEATGPNMDEDTRIPIVEPLLASCSR